LEGKKKQRDLREAVKRRRLLENGKKKSGTLLHIVFLNYFLEEGGRGQMKRVLYWRKKAIRSGKRRLSRSREREQND